MRPPPPGSSLHTENRPRPPLGQGKSDHAPAGLLARGSSLGRRLPGNIPVAAGPGTGVQASLTAYSCRDSRGIGANPAPHSRFKPRGAPACFGPGVTPEPTRPLAAATKRGKDGLNGMRGNRCQRCVADSRRACVALPNIWTCYSACGTGDVRRMLAETWDFPFYRRFATKNGSTGEARRFRNAADRFALNDRRRVDLILIPVT